TVPGACRSGTSTRTRSSPTSPTSRTSAPTLATRSPPHASSPDSPRDSRGGISTSRGPRPGAARRRARRGARCRSSRICSRDGRPDEPPWVAPNPAPAHYVYTFGYIPRARFPMPLALSPQDFRRLEPYLPRGLVRGEADNLLDGAAGQLARMVLTQEINPGQ